MSDVPAAAAVAEPLPAVAEEAEGEEEASTPTMERVAAAKKCIENHYRSHMKNIQEHKERSNFCILSHGLPRNQASGQRLATLGWASLRCCMYQELQGEEARRKPHPAKCSSSFKLVIMRFSSILTVEHQICMIIYLVWLSCEILSLLAFFETNY